jgi:hypothetical protein
LRTWHEAFGALGRAHTEILSLLGYFLHNPNNITIDASFSVKAFYLQLIVFDKELFYEFVENVPALAHKFGCLLFSHLTRLVYFRLLKVGKYQNEDPSGVPRDLHQVYVAAFIVHNLVEVAIKNLPLHGNTLLIVSDLHWRWSLRRNQVEAWAWLHLLLLRIEWWHGRVAINRCLLSTKLVITFAIFLA